MNELITIKNTRGFLDENGVAHLNLEDVARGLGFTRLKNGVEYVRWDRVHEYLAEIAFSPQVGKGEFIPENIFYKLCFKATNATARTFQDFVTDEVLPSIRKTGVYMTESIIEKVLDNPDFLIQLLTKLKAERNKNTDLAAKNDELTVCLNQSEKFLTIMKFNQHFNMHWDMKTCQRNGKAASAYSRQHGYEIRKCSTNDERFNEINSYAYEVLERLFLV